MALHETFEEEGDEVAARIATEELGIAFAVTYEGVGRSVRINYVINLKIEMMIVSLEISRFEILGERSRDIAGKE